MHVHCTYKRRQFFDSGAKMPSIYTNPIPRSYESHETVGIYQAYESVGKLYDIDDANTLSQT